MKKRSVLVSSSVALAFTLVLSTSSPAYAQSSNAVLAEAMFREAGALFDAGKIPEACAKLEESFRLDPASGTLYNLAQCREKEGRIATAWTHYSELSGRATQAGQTEKAAQMQTKLTALSQRMPRVKLKLDGRSDVTEVKVDGQALGRAAWGSALPLDPGEHAFVFSGAGKVDAEKRVALKEGETISVEIEPLRDRAASTPIAPRSESPATASTSDASTSGNRTLGYVLGGVGIAGVAAGSIFGVMALGQKSDADALYTSRDRAFKEREDAAGTSALISTIGFGVGIAGLAAGTYFILTSGSKKSASACASPWCTVLRGQF